MKVAVRDERYGEIIYQESFWSGKKKISINGTQLAEMGKNEYLYLFNDSRVFVNLKGNFMKGVTLTINGDKVKVVPSIRWYEVFWIILMAAVVLVWGNSPTLCSIVPIVGGAIGGAILGLCAVITLVLMKMTRKVGFKLLIGLGMLVLTVLSCFFVALALISVMLI